MREKKSEFPLRIVKRQELTGGKAMLLRLGALAVALVAGSLFLLALGKNPLEAYALILKGAFVGSAYNPYSSIQATVILAIPLLIVSLGLAMAFKMKFWNIGGEGQLIMGGIFSTYVALYHHDLPQPVLWLLMLVAGAVGGGIWALIPAMFKVRFGTNETLFTLMLNYIALYTVKFLEAGVWQRTPGFASIGLLERSSYLPEVFGIHIGWIFALLLMVIIFFYFSYTKQGYEINVVGESPATARYAGMRVNRIVLRTMFFSGAICGAAGMIQVAGIDHTLSVGITGGTGFTGITVAWLAQMQPFAIALVTFLFSILKKGSSVMKSTLKVDAAAADVLQAIILFFVLGCEFFARYRLVLRKPSDNKEGVERK